MEQDDVSPVIPLIPTPVIILLPGDKELGYMELRCQASEFEICCSSWIIQVDQTESPLIGKESQDQKSALWDTLHLPLLALKMEGGHEPNWKT